MKNCKFPTIYFLLGGLVAGAGIMYLISKSGKFSNAIGGGNESAGILKKGDKGKDILDFQKNMNVFFNLNGAVPETGMFDKQTVKAVATVFDGTSALVDPSTGAIDRNFVNDFNLLINREKAN